MGLPSETWLSLASHIEVNQKKAGLRSAAHAVGTGRKDDSEGIVINKDVRGVGVKIAMDVSPHFLRDSWFGLWALQGR